MCYMTFISTTSDHDLSLANTTLVQFGREEPDPRVQSHLKYKNIWHLGSQHGCSCGFRHLEKANVELDFSEPVDWWPEDEKDIEATIQVATIFRDLLNQKEKLDCIDLWLGDRKTESLVTEERAVNLALVPSNHFRFFEGHRFEFTAQT